MFRLFSYRAIFMLSPKKCYIQLTLLYRVRDFALHKALFNVHNTF